MSGVEAVAHVFWGWVLPAALQSAPVFVLAGCLDLLMPRLAAPQWRAGLWLLAAAKLVIPIHAYAPWGLLPSLEMAGAAPSNPLGTWVWAAPAAWLAGMALLASGSAWWVRGQRRQWQGHDRFALVGRVAALSAQFGIAAPEVAVTRALRGPVVAGLRRPVLYWPEGLEEELAEDECEQALRHELTHLKRRDGWRELFWFALVVVFWFNPLAWWAAGRMRALREQCCDREAARLPGHQAEEYLRALVRVAARVAGEAYRPALALVDPRAPLSHRMALLEGSRMGWRRRIGALASAAAMVLLWPAASWAERSSANVDEWIVKPPGSMQLRFLVWERIGKEKAK